MRTLPGLLCAAALLAACGGDETTERPSGRDASFPDVRSDAGNPTDTGEVPDNGGEDTPDVEPSDVPVADADAGVDPGDADAGEGSDATGDVAPDIGPDPDSVDGADGDDPIIGPPDLGPPTGPAMTVTIDPDDDSVGVDRNAPIRLTFSEPLIADTARGGAVDGACEGPVQVSIDAFESCVGLVTVRVDDRTFEVRPHEPWRLGDDVSVRVTRDVRSTANGAVAADVESIFRVEGELTPWAVGEVLDGNNTFPENTRIVTAGAGQIYVTWDATTVYIGYGGADITGTNQAFYMAFGAGLDSESPGLAYIPAERWFEGSTVYLPFHASHYAFIKTVSGVSERWMRRFNGVIWGPRENAASVLSARLGPTFAEFSIPRASLDNPDRLAFVAWVKDLGSDCAGTCADNRGFGWLYAATDSLLTPGAGDMALEQYVEFDLRDSRPPSDYPLQRRFGRDGERSAIYQLMVRTFGNVDDSRRTNGTLEENGSGRFDHINEAAAAALADMNFSHVWLTGVLQQATSTDYRRWGQPADDPDILKGRAGSPYAIRDYFDVSPDYAADPARRLEEFRLAVDRLHAADLEVLIDFVPNHVARSYVSDIRPELSFGLEDDVRQFYARDNAFFYLQSGAPPVYLPGFAFGAPISPTCEVLQGQADYSCDGVFDWNGQGEVTFGRVTGNDTASWTPSLGTWYETVKLNYGYNYVTRTPDHPTLANPTAELPLTWEIMDEVIAHWQRLGVDGFRVDMSHMVPAEFFGWLISRSRARNPNVFWVAEAYDSDPAKIVSGNALHALLAAGFDSVYDDASYDRLKEVFDAGAWANDVDSVLLSDRILHQHGLRYAENHDEVRLGSRLDWRLGGVPSGVASGVAVTGVLWAAGRSPFMLYAGQETGETASGVEGFGGDDGRTSIFDYWSMPSFTGWVNGHAYDGGGLTTAQRTLRQRYIDLIAAMRTPAFTRGEVWLLNSANRTNAAFGRLGSETVSGRFAHALLRWVRAPETERVLVFANLHPTETMRGVRVVIPSDAWARLGWGPTAWTSLQVTDRLTDRVVAAAAPFGEATTQGIAIGDVPAGTVLVLELQPQE